MFILGTGFPRVHIGWEHQGRHPYNIFLKLHNGSYLNFGLQYLFYINSKTVHNIVFDIFSNNSNFSINSIPGNILDISTGLVYVLNYL